MSWLLAVISGALLGLTNLPETLWWLGLSWGIVFVLMLYRSPKLSHLFVFVVSKQFVAYLWVLDSLLQHDDSLGSWVRYSVSSLLVSLPVWFGFALVLLVVGFIKADQDRKLFYRVVSLPLGYYLGHSLSFITPFGEVPGGEMGHQPFFLDTFGGGYTILGSLGIETLWVMFFLYLPLMFMLKENLQKLLLLPLLPLLFLIGLHYIGDFSKKEGESLEVLLLPWSGSIGTTPSLTQVVEDVKKRLALANREKTNLILLPEGAVPGNLQVDEAMKSLQASIYPQQKLLLGVTQKNLVGDRYLHFNAAALFSAGPTPPIISQKERIVPFVEKLPSWAKILGLSSILKSDYEVAEGENNRMQVLQHSFIVGICFEQYFDSFYASKDENASFYLFLNKEIDLGYYAKNLLYQVGEAKAMQTYKTVLRATTGGLSGVSAGKFKKEDQGEWTAKAIAGRYVIHPESKESLFYRWWVLTPFFLLGMTWVALSVAYSPYYKRG